MLDSVRGRIDETARRWVGDLINGLYGFLHVIFGAVQSGWARLYTNAGHWVTTLEMLANSVWQKLYHVIRVTLPAIINDYRTLIHNLTTYAVAVYHDLIAGLQFAETFASRLVHDAIAWVQANVWTPLFKAISDAWQWITHEGAILFDYITHPDKLAALIFDSLLALLEREAWNVADRLGRFALSLVARNLRQFAALIEDILSAIL